MANRKNIHVVPSGTGWATKREGADRPSSTHRTQTAAENAAKRAARQEHGEVFTHRRDRTIRDRDSYGNDPFPPQDRKH